MATGSDAEKSLIHASQVPPQRPVPEASIVAPSAQPAFCPHRPPSFFSRILTQRPRPLFLSNPPQAAILPLSSARVTAGLTKLNPRITLARFLTSAPHPRPPSCPIVPSRHRGCAFFRLSSIVFRLPV